MDNYKQKGVTLSLIAPYDRLAGQMAKIGFILGVAVNDVLSTIEGEFMTSGVFELPKVGSQAWTQGAKVYWDDTNKYLTTTANGNTYAGKVLVAVGSGAGETLGEIKLEPSGLTQAANIAALGAPVAVTGVDGMGNNAASKTDVDARLTAVYAKLDALIAGQKTAAQMASS